MVFPSCRKLRDRMGHPLFMAYPSESRSFPFPAFRVRMTAALDGPCGFQFSWLCCNLTIGILNERICSPDFARFSFVFTAFRTAIHTANDSTCDASCFEPGFAGFAGDAGACESAAYGANGGS